MAPKDKSRRSSEKKQSRRKSQSDNARREKRRVAQIKRRQEMKEDPADYEKMKARERERYADRIKKGKIKTVDMMSADELDIVRQKRRGYVAEFRNRQREKKLQFNDPAPDNENVPEVQKSKKGRKRIRKIIASKYYRNNHDLKRRNDFLQRKIKALEKKNLRMQKNNVENSVAHASPEVLNIIREENVSEKVKEKLLEGDALKSNFSAIYKETHTFAEKKLLRNIVHGNHAGNEIPKKKVDNIISYRARPKQTNRIVKKTIYESLFRNFTRRIVLRDPEREIV